MKDLLDTILNAAEARAAEMKDKLACRKETTEDRNKDTPIKSGWKSIGWKRSIARNEKLETKESTKKKKLKLKSTRSNLAASFRPTGVKYEEMSEEEKAVEEAYWLNMQARTNILEYLLSYRCGNSDFELITKMKQAFCDKIYGPLSRALLSGFYLTPPSRNDPTYYLSVRYAFEQAMKDNDRQLVDTIVDQIPHRLNADEIGMWVVFPAKCDEAFLLWLTQRLINQPVFFKSVLESCRSEYSLEVFTVYWGYVDSNYSKLSDETKLTLANIPSAIPYPLSDIKVHSILKTLAQQSHHLLDRYKADVLEVLDEVIPQDVVKFVVFPSVFEKY